MDHPPKFPSTPHWPWSESVQRDDSLLKNPDRFLNTPVVITEKLDGANTCLWNGEVYARSTGLPSHDGWMAMVRKHHAWKTIDSAPELVLYGEDIYGLHSIRYRPVTEDETFYLFAALSFARTDSLQSQVGKFLSWDEVEGIARDLDLKTVPVATRGEFSSADDITDWFQTRRKRGSAIGEECEGFVLRRAEAFSADDFAQSICKFVRAHHVQSDEHWSKNWQACDLRKN